ncbi:MAG: hypothetical protein FWH36_07005 [Lentimicrobiaceae bacterium]|nr:hypothetical protein [Lentimicrobiaceae bacterium]
MLKKKFYKYLRSLLIFSILIVAVYVALQHFANDLASKNTPYLIIVFLTITAITHYVVVKTDVERMEYKPNPDLDKEAQTRELLKIERRFITRYMLVTTVKILSFIALLGLYAYFNRADIVRFSLNFLALYLIYSLFEIIYIRKL